MVIAAQKSAPLHLGGDVWIDVEILRLVPIVWRSIVAAILPSPGGQIAGVNLEALLDVAEEDGFALGQHQRLVAHRAAQIGRMRSKQQNPCLTDELVHTLSRLLLKF